MYCAMTTVSLVDLCYLIQIQENNVIFPLWRTLAIQLSQLSDTPPSNANGCHHVAKLFCREHPPGYFPVVPAKQRSSRANGNFRNRGAIESLCACAWVVCELSPLTKQFIPSSGELSFLKMQNLESLQTPRFRIFPMGRWVPTGWFKKQKKAHVRIVRRSSRLGCDEPCFRASSVHLWPAGNSAPKLHRLCSCVLVFVPNWIHFFL